MVKKGEGCQWSCTGCACAKMGNQRRRAVQSDLEQYWTEFELPGR